MNKFKVQIDKEPVGVLRRWGDSEEFEVDPGSHTLVIKAFGFSKASIDAEFTDGEVVDLMCGFGKGAALRGASGGNVPIEVWNKDA